MIKKLYIKDFRNIKELTIEPSEYVNLISGNNGEGKSSILYAIEYLLTDNLNEKISEYVRWGCDKFFLEMEFEHDNDNYFIKIEGGKSAKKELSINGELNYKNSEATKKLAEIIDPNIIRYSSISEQDQTSQILFDTPTNRLKKLKEILGIDKISELCLDIKKDIDIKESTIKEADKEIKLLEERTYNFMEVPVVEDIDKIKKQLEILELDKKNYDLQSVIYETYLKDKKLYEDSIINLNTYNKEIEQLKDKIIELENSQKTYNHTETEEELRDKLLLLEKSKSLQENEYQTYLQSKKRYEYLLKSIQSNNEQLSIYQLRRIGQQPFTEEYIKTKSNDIITIKSNIIQNRKDIKLAEEGKCPTCGTDFKGVYDVSELRILLSRQETQLQEDLDLLAKAEKANKDYTDAVNAQEKVKIQRKHIEDSLITLQEELDVFNPSDYESSYQFIDYGEEIKNCRDKLDNRKQVIEFNVNISNEVKDLKNKIDTSIKLSEQFRTATLPFEVAEPEMYNRVEYEAFKNEVIIYETKVKEVERIEEHNKKIEHEQTANKERIKFLQSQIDLWSFESGILKETRQVLDKDFSAWLIDQGAEYLKEKMNEFFAAAYGKYDITFSQDKNSIDFFYTDGEHVAPCATASGHEKKVLGTGFRIALSSLNDLGLMVLDEIDESGSGDKSLQLYEAVLDNMKDTQFFIISHQEETKEMLLQQHGSKEFRINEGQLKGE